LERADRPDGGALVYRVAHRLRRSRGAPRLERTKVEGTLPLVL
jgi:hypothetical protein